MPITLDTVEEVTAPGERIRKLRLNAGLSPEKLGAQIGISGDTIRRLEQGIGPRCPHPKTMYRIAGAFDLDVIDIWTPEALLK